LNVRQASFRHWDRTLNHSRSAFASDRLISLRSIAV
jgi:hypothetical protein